MPYAASSRNTSFVELANDMKRRGLDYSFLLRVDNPNLVDFSTDKYNAMDKQSPEFKDYRAQIVQECKDNIWFFFREIVAGLEIDMASAEMIYLFANDASFISDSYSIAMKKVYHLLWYYQRWTQLDDYILTTTPLSSFTLFQKELMDDMSEMNIPILLDNWLVILPEEHRILNIDRRRAISKLTAGTNIVRQSVEENLKLSYGKYWYLDQEKHKAQIFDLDMSSQPLIQTLALQSPILDDNIVWRFYLINIGGKTDSDDTHIMRSWLHRIIPKFTDDCWGKNVRGGIYYL